MRFNNMSIQQIIAKIEESRAEGFSSMVEICHCLKELKVRKCSHPLFKDRVYRHFEAIADGKLHPGVVALFNGNASYLDHVSGRPMDLQKGMIAEREYDVAVEVRGEIVVSRKTVSKMSLATFQRLFPKDASPATVAQQKKELATLAQKIAANTAPTRTQHGPIVRADAALQIVKVGTISVPISVLRVALGEIGLSVVKARPARNSA